MGRNPRQFRQAARADVAALRREVAALRDDLRAVADAVHTGRRDLRRAGELEATLQSAALVKERMPTAKPFKSPRLTLEHALTLAPGGGMALEFGVYTGSTLEVVAHARDRQQVYGFDSFQGLPEAWRPGFPAGYFTLDNLPDVPGAELVVGAFADTLPGFVAGHRGPVDFLHIDCDLYSSTATVLEYVGPLLRPGSIVVFDEYFNYPGWPEHEHRAWEEYVAQSGLRFEYVAYTINDEQVVVKVSR